MRMHCLQPICNLIRAALPKMMQSCFAVFRQLGFVDTPWAGSLLLNSECLCRVYASHMWVVSLPPSEVRQPVYVIEESGPASSATRRDLDRLWSCIDFGHA